MLKVIDYIVKNGLAKTILDFKLSCKVYENKILLKYNMIDSDMSCKEVQECRGLVLEKDTWKIMSMSFYKFFNYGESNAVNINWQTATILEKLDGSMCHVYYDWNIEKWLVGTTGTAEGESEVNNIYGTSFSKLFWKTFKEKYNLTDDFFNQYKGHTFVFELTTPYNIVVKKHRESSITLITIRNNETLLELSRNTIEKIVDNKFPIVKIVSFKNKNINDIIKSFENMPFSEEGYVVVDDNFNRIKVKNPQYVFVHHLKYGGSKYDIMSIIKTNEIDEFLSYFPERKEEIFEIKEKFDKLMFKLNTAWSVLDKLKPIDSTPEDKKRFAMEVFNISENLNIESFSGLFFSLSNGKIESIDEYILGYDNKKLFYSL